MNIFHIPADQNFLAQLAHGIKARNLEKAVVLLPTQRACNKLAEKFKSSNNAPVILSLSNLEDAPQAVTRHAVYPLTYKLLLAQALVKRFSTKYSDALLIAAELHKIIAKFERDDVSLAEINNIKLSDAPQHIQQLVDYLKLIANKELDVLPPNTVSHIAQRNNAILRLRETQHEFPIIAAGLLGNTKPVAALLSTIAGLKNGFVVLHGMDTLPEKSWSKVDELHHSFILRTLLDELRLNRAQVPIWNHDESRDNIQRVGTAQHNFHCNSPCHPIGAPKDENPAHHQPSSRGILSVAALAAKSKEAVAIHLSQMESQYGLPRVCCADPRNDGTPASDFHGNENLIGQHLHDHGRAHFLTEAMCPAEHSISWHKLSSENCTILNNIEYLECKSLQEEALVIALKLEELKKHSSYKTVAVVTNETNLLKHLEPLGRLFDININDSFGTPCSTTPQIRFIYLLFDAVIKDFAPVQLLSLLKHRFYNKSNIPVSTCHPGESRDPHTDAASQVSMDPSFCWGDNRAFHGNSSAIERLELKHLRGICKYRTLEELIGLTVKHDEEAGNMLQDLAASCVDLAKLLQQKTASFSSILSLLLSTATNIASQNIWQDDTAKKVKDFLEDISKTCRAQINVSEFKSILNHCLHGKYIETPHTRPLSKLAPDDEMQGETERRTGAYSMLSEDSSTVPTQQIASGVEFRKRSTGKLDVQILSPIESRLLRFDYVILAGLNEKSWPTSIATDPWLISNLPKDIGLSNPHIQTGQAAHDFFCLMHHQNVLITRSEIIDNSPQIPSRWLVRLETVAKKIGKLDQIKPKRHHLLSRARSFYLPEQLVQYAPPSPKPPLNSRPRTLSVTQIESLIRDPYSVYASKILNLKKLDAIDKAPTHLEFGNFIHKVIDRFNKEPSERSIQTLMSYAREELRHISTRPIVAHMWIPRFEKIALWLIEFERIRRFNGQVKVYSEIKGSIGLQTSNGPLTLTAKADRIEINKNIVTIIDFKTGSIPTKSDVLAGFSPQLSLEALIAAKNGFKTLSSRDLENLVPGIQASLKTGSRLAADLSLAKSLARSASVRDDSVLSVGQLLYIQLSTGSKLGNTTAANANIQEIEHGVKQLLDLYMDENTPYLICPNPDKQPQYNEFEHLERVQEWSS